MVGMVVGLWEGIVYPFLKLVALLALAGAGLSVVYRLMQGWCQ